MERLSSFDSLVISQKKEWGEILSGFETKNKYLVLDSSGQEEFVAVEDGGSTLLRFFLKALRPFKIKILTLDNKRFLELNRPFRFYFHELQIFDSRGKPFGAIQRRFSILRRKYSVLNNSGDEIFELFGPLLHPWTFIIRKDDREYGKITKKWSGLLKEGFSDADNFGITFPVDLEAKKKALLLGAVFLIDFVHFENKGTEQN